MQSSNLNAISFLFVFILRMCISKFYWGYMPGNPKMDDFVNDNSKISFGQMNSMRYVVSHLATFFMFILLHILKLTYTSSFNLF